jgi:hypothetical protein
MTIIKDEMDALRVVNDALSQIDEGARIRVLEWMRSKYETAKPDSILNIPLEKSNSRKPKPAGAKVKTGKSKVVLKQIKDLNLYPKDKKSIKEFIDEKGPSSMEQKSVVAIYYLAVVLEISKVSIEHVYTVFKSANWIVPADLKNAIHRAGSAGWLDTSDSNDLKVTSSGENLVEHNLPKTKSVR